jgi:putative flippase GtrA
MADFWVDTMRTQSRLFRFLATGGFAALVNISSRYLLTPVIGFEASVLLAYLIGMITAYLLFRLFVFGSSGRTMVSEAYRFVLVNILALILVWVVSVGLARIVFPAIAFQWHSEDIAHLVAVCVPAISSYIGHLHFTFKRN